MRKIHCLRKSLRICFKPPGLGREEFENSHCISSQLGLDLKGLLIVQTFTKARVARVVFLGGGAPTPISGPEISGEERKEVLLEIMDKNISPGS